MQRDEVHRDEIIDEIHAVRAGLLEAAGGDLETLFADLKEHEAKEKRPVVVLPPRRPAKQNDVE